MSNDDEKTGPGPGPASGSAVGVGLGSGVGSGWEPVVAPASSSGRPGLFDHEKLLVYRVAREFLVLATQLLNKRMPRELHDQFYGSSVSILSNIAEGAGKTAKADKQRFYEIARGSSTEAAAQLDILKICGAITDDEYAKARTPLLRVAQMLSRLAGRPRIT